MIKRNYVIVTLLVILILVIGFGVYFTQKSENVEDNYSIQTMSGQTESIDDNKAGNTGYGDTTTTDNLNMTDIVVRYEENISEAFYGEPSGGFFYYINDSLVYEKPGEDQAFLSVIDGSEVKNYGKKADYRREGRVILAKTIDQEGSFCILEQVDDGNIYLVIYEDAGRKEILLHVEESTLEADFSCCALMLDRNAIYLRVENPAWKDLEEMENTKTLLVFSNEGDLLYEDYINDMEKKQDGQLVIIKKRPEAGFYIDFLEVNQKEATLKERRDFAAESYPRCLSMDRSSGQWYCIEGSKIEIFDIENVLPFGRELILNYGVDTSFKHVEESIPGDIYDTEMDLIDGQVCDNGLVNLMMGKREETGFVYRLYQYRRYEDTKKDNTLTITVPYPMPFVKQAVTLYEKEHSESHVRIESAYETYEDFETYINTYGEQMTAKIMAGDFGDIVCSSQGLYQELLLRSDAYLDLGKWVKSIESYDNLNKGALKGLTVKGALRALPIGVDLYYYGVNEKLAKEAGITDLGNLTWGQLLDVALQWKKDGVKGNSIFGSGIVGEDQLGVMIVNNLNDLMNVEDKTCDLKQEWFVDLMKKWKEVYDSGHMYSYGQAELYRERNGEDTRFMNGFEKGSLLQAYARRALQFDWMDVSLTSEAEQFWRYNAAYDCPQQLIGGINGEKSRNFNSYSSIMFSVNARAEHKEEALRFMEFLVSERVQRLDSVPGIPMNLAVDRENWEKAARSVTKEMETEYLTPEKVMEYYERFSAIYEEIDQMYPDYYSLYIERPMMSYISGTMTLEEAIDKAEQDLWLHLNE